MYCDRTRAPVHGPQPSRLHSLATEGDVPVPSNRCPLLALGWQGLSSRGRDGRACRRHWAIAAVGGCSGTRQDAKSRHRGGLSKRSAWPGGSSCTARKVDCESVISKNSQLAIMDLAHDDYWRIPLWMKGGHLQPSPYRRVHARAAHPCSLPRAPPRPRALAHHPCTRVVPACQVRGTPPHSDSRSASTMAWSGRGPPTRGSRQTRGKVCQWRSMRRSKGPTVAPARTCWEQTAR